MVDPPPVHPALERAFIRLSADGVRWALMRPPSSLSAPRGDVDVLVHPDDRIAAGSALIREGYAPIAASTANRAYLAYHDPSRSWIHVDFTSSVLPDAVGARSALVTACLARSGARGAVRRLHPEDEFWALLLRIAERAPRIRRRHWELVGSTYGKATIESAIPVEMELRVPGSLARLRTMRDAVASGNLEELRTEALRLRRVLRRRRRPVGDALTSLRRPVRAWRHRGVSVALLGPDGAGKSTLAHCLADRSFFPARVIYMGTGVSGEVTARPRPLRMMRGPVLFSLAGIATQWGRYLVGLAERIRGRLVIFDRYTEEALLPARPSDPVWRRLGRTVRRFVVCPPPELAVILDAPGGLMYERKGEHDVASLELDRERYRALARRLPRVALIDARQPPDRVCSEAMSEIWRVYVARIVGPQHVEEERDV